MLIFLKVFLRNKKKLKNKKNSIYKKKIIINYPNRVIVIKQIYKKYKIQVSKVVLNLVKQQRKQIRELDSENALDYLMQLFLDA